MDRSHLKKTLLDIIERYQKLSDDDFPEELRESESCTMDGVEGFDSMRGAEVSSKLNEELEEEVGTHELIELFDPETYEGIDKLEDITLGYILDHLEEKLAQL